MDRLHSSKPWTIQWICFPTQNLPIIRNSCYFILSDGQPTDGNDPPLQKLSNLGVTIVSCLITNQLLADPRHLYSILDKSCEKPAKTIFRMSSIITTQKIPRTLFLKRRWKIGIDNNKTRLFFQVNLPDLVKEVCDMANKKGVLC